MQDRAAWVCLYAPDAVQEFMDEFKAREEQPDEDSLCIWCHHRDEREARKLIRDALKTTPRPM
jgi:uroporphyrinogen-III synthase